ncbi:MAG: cellulose binding domain-containing protein [Aquabacterium sp.]
MSLWASGQALAATKVAFTIHDLGTLGGPESTAYGINNAGQIAGEAQVPAVGGGEPVKHAVIWQAGKPTDLGVGAARAINSLGHVAGSLVDASGQSRATLWVDQVPTFLGTGTAFGINDQDHVAGALRGEDGVERPAVWRNQVAKALSTLPGQASGINNNGQVAGYTRVQNPDASISYTALKWVNDVETVLSGVALANAINDANVVVGASSFSNTLVWYPSGRMQSFYPSNTPSSAYAINKAGWVVGHGYGDANLWDVSSGRPMYLGALMYTLVNRPPNLEQLTPLGINDKNEIVGSACYGETDSAGQRTRACRAFLMTPTTLPSCSLSYAISTSSYAYMVTVTLRNETDVDASGWQVNLTLKDKTFTYQPTNAKVKTVSGNNVTATPLASNTLMPANQSTLFTFRAFKFPSTVPAVTAISATLAGQKCVVK